MSDPVKMHTRLGDYLFDFAWFATTPAVMALAAIIGVLVFHHLGYRDSAVACGGAFIAFLRGDSTGLIPGVPFPKPKVDAP